MKINNPLKISLLYYKFKSLTSKPSVVGYYKITENNIININSISFDFNDSDIYNINKMKEIEKLNGFNEWKLIGDNNKFINYDLG